MELAVGLRNFYLGYRAGNLRLHLQRISEVGQKLTLGVSARLAKKAKADLHHEHGVTDVCVRAQHHSHGVAHRTLQRFLQHRQRNCQRASETNVREGI